jgi:uncharacterized protein YoxC
MEISLVIAAVAFAVVLFWFVRNRKKEARRLDDLHITQTGDVKKK